jgi:hypothetical protein
MPDRAHDFAALHATAETELTEVIDVTEAVFHAPMFALNADADVNACEPTTQDSQTCKVSIRS